MKNWNQLGFKIEETNDGSPSLRILHSHSGEGEGESMHHSGGACSETLMIYGKPIHATLEKLEEPRFMIVGLGLGYIELTIAREALLLGYKPTDIDRITSFESVPELKEFFLNWLWGRLENLEKDVYATYEKVMEHVIGDTSLKTEDLKMFLRHFFKSSEDILDALTKDTMFSETYQCILYDAFSSKTNPELWDEEFLTDFLTKVSGSQCYFSTYACKGSLKRSLRNNNFEVIVREGFQGKRNSTLAVKGM